MTSADYYFSPNSILKIEDLHQFHTAAYMFKFFSGVTDGKFLNALRTHSNLHQYSTRNNSNVVLPLFRKSKSQNSLEYVDIKTWNNLSSEICQIPSLKGFKGALKRSLLEKYEY